MTAVPAVAATGSAIEARHALLRVLHPDGYRDLRALRGSDAQTASFSAGQLTAVDAFATDHQEWNVFTGVATRTANGRDLKDCLALHALFADIDFKDFPSEAEARAKLASFPKTPSAVVASGGGLQVYWFLEMPMDLRNGGAGDAKRWLRQLATEVGGDLKAAEPARILRLPGTLNHKYNPPRLVAVETFNDTRYTLPPLPTEPVENTPAPLPPVVATGSRNSTLFREGCRLRRLGWSEEEIAKALLILNAERCHPPLDAQEVKATARSCSRYEPATDLFPLTEAGDAEFFAAANADSVRYDHLAKAWLHFREHYWEQQTDGEIHRLALDTIRARQKAAIGDKDRMRWAIGGESRRRQENLLTLAEKVKPLADAGFGWDIRKDCLGVRNGLIDLRTGALRPGEPEDRVTLVSPLVFDPAASTAKWRRFVLDVCDDNEELADYFQVMFGYILTGETGEQCFWIFYGEGANGKSTLLETISQHVIPNHSWTMSFPSAQWTDSMSGYQKAMLMNRRLVVSKENRKSQKLNTELIKGLTGDEEIEARHPYGRPFKFKPLLKFVLNVNHKPSIQDETHGMWRRVRLVPFLRTFEPNPAFAESLVREAGGALAWMVEGAVRYYRVGLKTPDLVKVATEEYRKESDSLAPFFEERCVFGEAMWTKAQEMFDELRDWYDCRETPPFERMSQKAFGQWIAKDSRFKVTKGTGQLRDTVLYVGVGLRERKQHEAPGGL